MTELRPVHETVRFDGTNVTAVLGPTNTGKTFLAIERMVAHSSGTIGLPLRLLAREVYQKVCDRVGVGAVALITGEEKIKPPNARYSVCTVEAMPRDPGTAFVAIDEVQLASDLERGHVFTDRILHARGREETLLLGSSTMQGVLQRLLKGMNTVTRPRLSNLVYAGSKKITRLPRRTAIVAFSAEEVYAIAELIRRQRGGAAVVMGALSPRTRNAQVELYQSGEVDFLVATDAIGMGLNLDVDHVAFAQDWKFDGFQYRQLTPAEFAQIAGRAGRHLRDGTFGVTGKVDPLPQELVEALEAHAFQPVRVLQWRSREFDFASIDALRRSLEALPPSPSLSRSLPAVDQRALEFLSKDSAVADRATTPARVELLWEACKLPDYRRIAPAQHAEIIATIYGDLTSRGRVAEDYMAAQVLRADRAEGDIDTLSQRIAEIRTWTYISHRPGWLADPTHWQEKTREVEDRLSDALHDRLTKRFVDRRTSVLMRRLRENAVMEAEIGSDGTVVVEGHPVGELQGFRFTLDGRTEGTDGKAVRAASQKALAGEFEKRAERFANAPNGDLALASDGLVRWLGAPIASLTASDDVLAPKVVLLADEQLTGPARDKVASRAERFVTYQVSTVLKPLADLKSADALQGTAKGIAYRLYENLGTLQRREVAEEVRALEQDARAALRRCGVRFGAYHIFVPALIKPAPAALVTLLWAIKNDGRERPGYGEATHLLATGRTSAVADATFDPVFYGLAGYRLLGRRAVRVDILERLADLIRPALAWKPGTGKRPDGAYNGAQFLVTPAMMSILGATAEDMEEILKGLGYRPEGMEAPAVEAELHRLDAEAVAAEAAAKAEANRKAAEAAAKADAPQPEPGDAATSGEAVTEAADEPVTVAADAPETAAPAVEAEASSDDAASVGIVVDEERDASAVAAGEAGEPAAAAPQTTAVSSESAAPAGDEAPAVASDTPTAATPEVAALVEEAVSALAEDVAPAEDTAAEAATAAEPAAADSAETAPEPAKIIQVWRPQRAGGRPGQRPGQNRGRGRGAGNERGGERTAAPEGERPARERGTAPRTGDKEGGGREGGGKFASGKGRGRPDKQRPEKDWKKDRAGGEERQSRRFEQPQQAKPQRVADPDSPFAKLAALRDKLGK
ncbi:helicase-related protein [Aurantimonas endophytica]|uniref:ATP-dependent RNA helicase SUPV3L1/SUV3 n=1 Tax=Aurantimonas endophytica TaxID=1522175 RepID=A0A7W6MPS9_9HYPH|nr:helicase-related protein [Aurantimonas endophytica]MBB4003258.1 ATP-dependent RNA helicase SUPV3L1/SUV3 [Aurantimonas endophytica]MCO6404120.1 helicase [Aurantimonas endophytica]